MPAEQHAVGDPFPPHCAVIEVHVGELKQLYNEMDPTPFRDRDLDPKAEEFIVDWSRETKTNLPLGLIVHLGRQAARSEDAIVLRQAVQEFFKQRALATRRELRQLLRLGRKSLLWRPFEIFLYEWWPILDEARLYDRLSAMQVRLDNPSVAVPGVAATPTRP